MTRNQFDAGARPKPRFEEAIRRDATKLQREGRSVQPMLSFITDPYHLGDTTLTRTCLQTLAEHGQGFCTLSKGGLRALRDLPLFRATHDAYATSLTSISDVFAERWERLAAPPSERMRTLQRFYEAGIYTWVSLEPIISVQHTLAVIALTAEYTCLYKIGPMNHLVLKEPVDLHDIRYAGLRVAVLHRPPRLLQNRHAALPATIPGLPDRSRAGGTALLRSDASLLFYSTRNRGVLTNSPIGGTL
jgi:hypothetical protein